MYCYDSIWINGKRRGQIEHGIEKANSAKLLSDCVPNLGIACELCNGSFKRRGEAKRKLPIESINEFAACDCKKYDCKKPCTKYKKLRNEYIRAGKILLQPFDTKIYENGKSLRLQYDLLNCKYIISKSQGEYNKEEKSIIEGHIKLFGLNSPERKNFEVSRYCKNVIDNHSINLGYEYNNLLVDLFRRKLQCVDLAEAVKICRVIYSNAFYQFST